MTAPAPALSVGPHDLIVQLGDSELYGLCSCGVQLGKQIRPNQSLDEIGQRWERHVMAEHRNCECDWHQL